MGVCEPIGSSISSVLPSRFLQCLQKLLCLPFRKCVFHSFIPGLFCLWFIVSLGDVFYNHSFNISLWISDTTSLSQTLISLLSSDKCYETFSAVFQQNFKIKMSSMYFMNFLSPSLHVFPIVNYVHSHLIAKIRNLSIISSTPPFFLSFHIQIVLKFHGLYIKI